jgi:putative membrane protein
MERPQDINSRTQREAIKLIIIFHLIGLLGLSIPFSRSWFVAFVPWHLAIMFVLVFFNHHVINAKFIAFLVLIFAGGIWIEYTGVHSHWPFGDYIYGTTLGRTKNGIPPIIGINWFLLIYATAVAMQRSKLQRVTSRIVVGAVVLVLLDLLIEPIAVRLNYWSWAHNHVPLSNYISWFVISIIMLGLFEAFRFGKQNKVAPVLLLVQFIFFAILQLTA